MTSTKTIQDMTPEEIDEILFPLWARRWQTAKWLQSSRGHVVGSFFPGCRLPGETYPRRPLLSYQLGDAVDQIRKREAELVEIETEMSAYETEFDARGGWSRYVLCGTRNGHLHYRGCSTLRWNTELLLIPQASGLDSSEVVGKFGETACTKCFPGAPVNTPTVDPSACAGTGKQPVEGTTVQRYRSSYGECPECSTRQIVTASYRIRKHKTPKES